MQWSINQSDACTDKVIDYSQRRETESNSTSARTKSKDQLPGDGRANRFAILSRRSRVNDNGSASFVLSANTSIIDPFRTTHSAG